MNEVSKYLDIASYGGCMNNRNRPVSPLPPLIENVTQGKFSPNLHSYYLIVLNFFYFAYLFHFSIPFLSWHILIFLALS